MESQIISEQDIAEALDKAISREPRDAVHEGHARAARCAASRCASIQALRDVDADFAAMDILPDPRIRQVLSSALGLAHHPAAVRRRRARRRLRHHDGAARVRRAGADRQVACLTRAEPPRSCPAGRASGSRSSFADPIIAKVDERMREVIEGAGGIGVVIPHSNDPDSWQAGYELVDAVVMMGGPDVAAEAYGATPHPLTKPGHAGIDTTDLGLARACLRDGKPVLGICRGAQVLNVAAGGTLVQDVPSTGTAARAHGRVGARRRRPAQLLPRDRGAARARSSPTGSGAGKHVVNSYHHQAVDRLGDGPAHRGRRARRHDRGDRVDERRLRRRPAVAQRVPHARRRALRAPAAGARRRRARLATRRGAGGDRRPPLGSSTWRRPAAASPSRRT